MTNEITLAYGRCQCLMPIEKHYITKALEDTMKNIDKDMGKLSVSPRRQQAKMDNLIQERNDILAILGRVGSTPDCK